MRRLTGGELFRRAVAAGALAVAVGLPTAASAQTLYTGTPAPNVGAADMSVGGSSAAGSAPGVVTSGFQAQGSNGLALTGIDVADLGLVGLGAIATGTVLVRRGRPTR